MVAAISGRCWPLQPTIRQVVGFVAAGLAITIGIEWLSTDVLGRWAYSDRMPVMPLLGTGLLPVAQWILLPPLVVWLVRRQLT